MSAYKRGELFPKSKDHLMQDFYSDNDVLCHCLMLYYIENFDHVSFRHVFNTYRKPFHVVSNNLIFLNS